MKGILHKKINGSWVVLVKSEEPPACSTITEHGTEYPIHPEYVKCYFLDEDAEGAEVEFEFVKEYDEGGVKGITRYAKLIKPTVPKLGNEDVPKLGYEAQIHLKEAGKIDMHAMEWVSSEENSKKWSNNTDEIGDNYGSFVAGWNKCKENTYTEEEIDKLLSFYTDDAPASYIKRDYKKYLQSLKQPK